MFIAVALLEDLEVPSRLSRLALSLNYNVAIGEDGVLRVWDAEEKLRRVDLKQKLLAVDLQDDTLLLSTAAGTVCIG